MKGGTVRRDISEPEIVIYHVRRPIPPAVRAQDGPRSPLRRFGTIDRFQGLVGDLEAMTALGVGPEAAGPGTPATPPIPACPAT